MEHSLGAFLFSVQWRHIPGKVHMLGLKKRKNPLMLYTLDAEDNTFIVVLLADNKWKHNIQLLP